MDKIMEFFSGGPMLVAIAALPLHLMVERRPS
jgi:hypothetical protein